MNKKFIKKNIFLIAFMSMALVVVIVLLVMVLSEHRAMKQYDAKKAELLVKINKIFKQQYAPVKVNVARIEGDIEGYQKECDKIESQFGHPYQAALKAFTDNLGIPLDDFKAKFNESWEKEKSGKTRDQVYRLYKVQRFNNDFKGHKSTWDTAMGVFMREAQKVTLEDIDESNVDGIFLAVMGRGRRFSDSALSCQIFMKRMRYKMIDYFVKQKKIDCVTTDFSFNHDQLPLVGDIERIARAWEIIADLGKRIANAKVNPETDKLELEKFSKRGLDGEKDGNYTSYRFSFTINGDLATIRRVVNNLYEAYKDKRIYAVRNITLTKLVDGVGDIIAESEKIRDDLDYDTEGEKDEKRPPTGETAGSVKLRPDSSPNITNKRKTDMDIKPKKSFPVKSVAKEKKILGPKDPGYGKVIIGANNICRAEFEVDYIVFSNSQNN